MESKLLDKFSKNCFITNLLRTLKFEKILLRLCSCEGEAKFGTEPLTVDPSLLRLRVPLAGFEHLQNNSTNSAFSKIDHKLISAFQNNKKPS